jgi:PAS domain S-box-containing protein
MRFLPWIIALLSVAAAVKCLLLWRSEHRQYHKSLASRRRLGRKLSQLEQEQRRKKTFGEATEEKLRRYLQLMDVLINTMPNPIYFKDGNGIFQGCNKMFARTILGLTRDRIIGQRPQDLPQQIPPDLAARYQREEIQMIQKRGFHAFEAPVHCSDGIQREFLFGLAPVLDSNNEAGGWVAVLADLTDKNRAIQDRMQREKLESVLETAGAVCHELNQPLQSLSGYTELMAVKIDSQKAAADYLVKMMDQIERMRDITDKLQGITRYETVDYAGNSKIINIHQSSD